MRILFFIALSLCIFGCNKPNPNPEKIDPIYADLQKRYAEYKKYADDEKKTLSEHEKTLKEAKPQTGQIKYAEKRYYESKLRLEKLEQMVRYFEIRIESRLQYARADYLKSWNKKEAWPKANEYSEYLSVIEAQMKRMSWDPKERIKNYKEEEARSKIKTNH